MDSLMGFAFKNIFKGFQIQSLKMAELNAVGYASESKILKYAPSTTITKLELNQFFNNMKNMVVLK